MKSHVDISFAMLEFDREFDMETSYKEVAYELHHIYDIVYDKRVFGVAYNIKCKVIFNANILELFKIHELQ
jgi:hypothetical protein